MHNVSWKKSALDDLYAITSKLALQIKSRIEKHLVKSPRELGKALTGKYKGLLRYRYGSYRVIYEIDKENELIIIIRIGHRSAVYDMGV
jgi:mRNA interferase RelE/StbE